MSRVSALLDLLEEYDPSPEEAEPLGDILDLLYGDGDALSAEHFTPGHITASGFVVDTSRTRLLLIHHRKLDTWLQPGGHVDPGEDVLAAAIREVEEETGVVGLPLQETIFDIDVHPIPARPNQPAHTHFDVRFLLRAQDDALTHSDEVLGVRWVPFAEVSDLATDRSVLRVVEKLAVL